MRGSYFHPAQRVSKALNVSERTVYNVANEERTGQLLNPSENRKRCGRKAVVIDSFTEGVIRRAVLQSYAEKKFPTLTALHATLSSDPNFPEMKRTTLRNIMKNTLKFKYVKTQGKPVPMERVDIAASRADYLTANTTVRKVKYYRRNGYSIFYQDETWINEHACKTKAWHIPEKEILSMSNSRPHVDIWLKGVGHRFADGLIGGFSDWPSGAGRRIIIVHLGSENGFLRGAGRVFSNTQKKPKDVPETTDDYHADMSTDYFVAWIKEIVDFLPEKSVLVLDQASYHKTIEESSKNPRSNWRKAKIIAWLENKKAQLPSHYPSFEKMTIPLLRQLAKKYHEDEEIIVERIVKTFQIIKRNQNPKLKEVEMLTKTVLEEMEADKNLWEKCVEHVIRLEDLLMEKENLVDDFMERIITPIIIPVCEGDSTEESSDEESDSESESNGSESELNV
ncbi:Ribosomal RNA small subunit methyltransferase G [Folsomia candida]|uniref:Ribosomal RNA small subunit methyltransferase G n=1 Tax=Folsomia candida TaxID=158441 RepID=A0A226EW70_FOLCA|nr:Ribosomal RNA small subunit methyltransferase G [Folsomia candida]